MTLSNSETANQIILQYGTEEVVVSAEEAKGKTVEQLYEQYGEDLGYYGNGAYRSTGTILSPATLAVPGTVYTASRMHDSKGQSKN